MQSTKKTLILSSQFGPSGMATFTRVGSSINFAVTVFTKDRYKIELKGDIEKEWEVFSSRSCFVLPNFDFDRAGVAVYVDGKIFCRGGFFEEVENEESKVGSPNESEECESETEQKKESLPTLVSYID